MKFLLKLNRPPKFIKIKPTFQTYFENLLLNFKPDCKSIYLLPSLVTMDTNLRMFQYKLLINVLYLNNMFFRSKNVDFSLCSYCNKEEQTLLHLFYFCLKIKQLCNKLRPYFSQYSLYSTKLHSRNIS